jgi:hypothetical protein
MGYDWQGHLLTPRDPFVYYTSLFPLDPIGGAMMQKMSKIKPNSARMWDYVMGGAHNFGVDRAAVNLIRKLSPVYDEMLRAQRRFLQRAATYMAQEKGLDKFLDFGSGLPTRSNVHEIVQAVNSKAKVIYSDNDSIAVAFGQEILGDKPNVRYVHCDIADPYALLESPAVAELFGAERRVGIGLVGVLTYVPDEPAARFFTTLYEWVDRGSYVAVSTAARKADEVEGARETFRKLGLRLHARSAQELLDLIGPWQLTEDGLVPGFYWGLPEEALEINEQIREYSYCFVAYK